MRKILFWFFSAALTAAGTLSASAAAPLALRASGSQSQLTATAQTAPAVQTVKRVQELPVRSNTSSAVLSRALSGAPAVAMPATQRVAPRSAGAAFPNLHGFVSFNDTFEQGHTPTGLYKINNGSTELVFETTVGNYGTIILDGVIYTNTYANYGFFVISTGYAIDADTGEALGNFDLSIDNLSPAGFTQDPTTGTVYGITYNSAGDALQLSKVDFSLSGETTTAIAPMEGNWNAIVCDAQGQLYGIKYYGQTQDDTFVVTSSELYKIDKTSGNTTLIGNTGMLPQYLSSACIDHATGKMYWNVCAPDETGVIAEVDLATGLATKICDLEYNDEILGMYVAAPEAGETAPAVPMNVQAVFPEGSLSGKITFDAPTTLFNGTPATGALSYKLLMDGEVEAEGNTAFGATNVEIPVEVYLPAEYQFVLTVSNAAGSSPKAKVKVFIGNGAPEGPANVALEYSNGNLNLSWDAVTTTSDGGYINPADVRYNVFDAEGAKVADMIAVTSWSTPKDMPAQMTTYKYSVQAVSAGFVSPKVESNAIVLGSIVPPYQEALTGTDLPAGFTVIDANGDGKVWETTAQGTKIMYNSNMAMDDYLVLPPLSLEGGKMYSFSMETFANSTSYAERVEVKMGTQPTVAGLTSTVIPSTDVTWNVDNVQTLEGYLLPATSGIYYVAVHGISDADKFALFVRNINIGGSSSTAAPDVCTDIVVTPDAAGALKTAISFKAPSTTMAGNALSAITKIEVKRGTAMVKTFENPAPGATLSCEDVLTAGGDYIYTFTAYNADGEGKTAKSESVFVGFGLPDAPASVTIAETGNTGKVTLSWPAVTTDVDGRTFPEPVTYLVCEPVNGSWTPMVENLSATTYEFQAVPEGEQDFVQYAVFAVYQGDNGKGTPTGMVAVGTPYPSIDESFADGSLSYILGTGYSEGASWSLVDDSQYSDLASYDGDNGFLACSGEYLEYKSSVFTGKVSLEGMANPGVSYATFVISDDDINELNVYVKEPADADWTQVNSSAVSTLGLPASWAVNNISLAAYAGKVVQVRFEAVVKAYKVTTLDAIKVGDLIPNDLAAHSISAPTSVQAGSDYKVDVTVGNNGTADATEFTVKLIADNEVADTKTVSALESGKSVTVSFDRTMSAVATVPAVYSAEVVYAPDEDNSNNTTEQIAVAPKYSTLPTVGDLAGAETAQGVKLTWSEPDLSAGVTETKTEDFELAQGWAHEVDGWTFIDEDDSAVGGFQGMEVPGITAGTTKASFFVWDQTDGVGNQSFNAHSGMKYLAALFRYDDGQTSDWAISPALSGNAQTVSFYARSYSGTYPEKIEVYYGNGDAVSDFTASNLLLTVDAVPAEWTLYEVRIPEGATRFAIHSCASGSFMLMIDDVTYETGSSTADVSIIGYDVYRNGEKLTAQPTAECEYTDTAAPAGTNNYQVVAVYNKGISAPAAVSVENSGLDKLTAGISVRTADGCIIVAGAEGRNLVVNAVNGTTVHAGTAEATTRVAVSAGVYLVKVDGSVVKVIVR